jgi:3-methyl-2-oxobutanoate hydroxymethyltransferase
MVREMKGKRRIAMLTCYDYSMAVAMDAAAVPLLLVGDSLGNVILGFGGTREVRMRDMVRHTAAVARGAKSALVVADMPFGSYESSGKAVRNAGRLLAAGAGAVKIEGRPHVAGKLCGAGICVMGHAGLLPQTAKRLGVSGRGRDEARVMRDAIALEKAGCFALVLECIPEQLGRKITQAVGIPTIGIGAGRYCDGQVLVSYDMLGLFSGFHPRFVRKYAALSGIIKRACSRFREDVEKGVFPEKKHCFE